MRSRFDANALDDESEVFADFSERSTEVYSRRRPDRVVDDDDDDNNSAGVTAGSSPRNTVEVFLVQPTAQNGEGGDNNNKEQRRILKKNWWASHVARHPWLHFWAALIAALGFSAGGLATGDLVVDPDLVGWFSRGTEIAKKQQQVFIVQSRTGGKLSFDAGWDDLINDVQPSWETSGTDFTRRRLEETTTTTDPTQCDLDW